MVITVIAFILALIYVLIEFLAGVPNFDTRHWGVWFIICVIVIIIAVGSYYRQFLAIFS